MSKTRKTRAAVAALAVAASAVAVNHHLNVSDLQAEASDFVLAAESYRADTGSYPGEAFHRSTLGNGFTLASYDVTGGNYHFCIVDEQGTSASYDSSRHKVLSLGSAGDCA